MPNKVKKGTTFTPKTSTPNSPLEENLRPQITITKRKNNILEEKQEVIVEEATRGIYVGTYLTKLLWLAVLKNMTRQIRYNFTYLVNNVSMTVCISLNLKYTRTIIMKRPKKEHKWEYFNTTLCELLKSLQNTICDPFEDF